MTFGMRRIGKFNASKQEYKGEKFDSKLEVGFVKELEVRLQAGERFTWERQRLIS